MPLLNRVHLYCAELVVAKSVCKAREADLAVLSETHRQMEESLRAALSQANDALRACEAQKGSIESTTFSTLREMQEKLDQESLLHEAAEQSAAKAISGYQAQIQLLTEEVNFTKSDAEQRIAAVVLVQL